MLPAALERVLRGTAEAFRVTIDLKCRYGPVPRGQRRRLFRRGGSGPPPDCWRRRSCPLGTGSDDFSYYTQRVPGVYAFLGTGAGTTLSTTSASLWTRDALAPGSRLYAHYAEEYLRGGCL